MTKQIKCVVVDDEPLAIEVITSYLDNFDHLELVSSFQNPIKAFEFIQSNPIDVLFMDIQMPKLTGLDMLKSLNSSPQVIITTAYRDYALEGFELDVVDYLLKPISLERFIKAISRIKTEKEETNVTTATEAPSNTRFFKVDKRMVKVDLDEVLYFESQREYLKIITHHCEVVTRMGISDAENEFSTSGFIRVHRSFLVSVSKITSFSQAEIEINNHSIPIGRNYREIVSRELATLVG